MKPPMPKDATHIYRGSYWKKSKNNKWLRWTEFGWYSVAGDLEETPTPIEQIKQL